MLTTLEMVDPHLFALFILTGLALNLTPGPDMLYVLASGVKGGRPNGVAAAAGIGVGGLVHTALAAVGLSALIVSSANAFAVVKYLGAAYLVFVGGKALLARGGGRALESSVLELHGSRPAPSTLSQTFARGVITNVLNPKVAIFFLAFVPQFVDASRGHIAAQFAILGTMFCISGTLVNAMVGWLSGSARHWFSARGTHRRWQGILDRVTGAIFVALGIRLALVERN
ncbi:LysE family translocator [Pendulispora albinea]|uniref:LysE family translocator n=1 Tax=Pendulispora albinea TaxID=2741071 RepID=A0ABZ2LK47_9BACT